MPEGEITEADDLYGLDPTEFTAARNVLAKRLKAEGRKDDAAAVAQLRRPTATAWALDRVARDQPALIADALEAGARLREATEAAVAGDPGALRDATAADRAASDAVVDAAAAQLGARGQAAKAQLTGNLRAAVLDEAVADELRRGVLAADHGAAGFGFGFDTAPATTAATPSRDRAMPDAKKPAATKADAGEARGRREAERRAREEVEERARRERRRLADLEADVKRLDHRYERLSRVADRAEEEATRSRAEADAAALEAEAARRALDDAT